jgi:hypothetical protein
MYNISSHVIIPPVRGSPPGVALGLMISEDISSDAIEGGSKAKIAFCRPPITTGVPRGGG